MNQFLTDYYRCPSEYVRFELEGELSADQGYFRFGDAICFGRSSVGRRARKCNGDLYDVGPDVRVRSRSVAVPFDPEEIVDSLRCERYAQGLRSWNRVPVSYLRKAYYALRPLLPVAMRRQLQRAYASGGHEAAFPRWPVDLSVEYIAEGLLAATLRAHALNRLPFIWFWPDGAPGCAILTHDVETAIGRDYCSVLMDVEEGFGVRSSFQVVPEERYSAPPEYLDKIRRSGCEINVHDLNHDGRLYDNYERFRSRMAKINQYRREFGALGFRAGVLYRNVEWFSDLQFSYDMSVPNMSNLDPQKGGCCTVMPYFIGDVLEIPVTTVQDYSLFHILRTWSLDLWKTQISLIMGKHGLASFIVHPDYVTTPKSMDTYRALLDYLCERRSRDGMWIPLPREVDQWWRQRSKMRLVREGRQWRIEGEGKERARIAYAVAVGEGIAYEVETEAGCMVRGRSEREPERG